MKTILVCDSAEHAELVDQLVFARLQEAEGARGNGWSGVLTDGTRYGILWGSPVSDLFGLPEDFPELVLVEETQGIPWSDFVPEPEPEPEPEPPTPV